MRLLIIAAGSAQNQGSSLRVFNLMQMVGGHVEIQFLSTYQKDKPRGTDQFYFYRYTDTWKSKMKKLLTYYKTDFSEPHLQGKPDIVQIVGPHFFGLKKFFPDIPIILDEHSVFWNLLKYDMISGPTVSRLPFHFALVPWLRWRAKEYEINALKEAAHTFVCSTTDRDEILKELPQLGDRISVVPNCVDLSAYTPSEQLGETILFIGSMTYSANRDAAKIICEQLAPRVPQIPFQIVGEGEPLQPHPPNVHFLGYVSDIKPYLSNCRIFIVPLRFGSGTRFKILEAMAMQRPVISTSRGAEGLEVTHGKNIWIEDDWSLFVQAVLGLWNDPARLKSIATGGRRLIEARYDYRLFTPQVIGIYQSLVS